LNSGDQIDKNEMGGTCSTYRGKRGAYRVLVGNLYGTRPLGRSRLSWENNIKIYVLEVGWETWTVFIWLKRRTGGGHL